MAVFYLDTSALLIRYKTEAGSYVIDELFSNKAAPETFATSYYTVLEITSVARRLLKGRVLDRRSYNAMMSRFLNDAEQYLVLQSVSDDVISGSVDVAERYALKPGDALQLATAFAVNESISGETFVLLASDRDMHAAALAAGVQVMNPEDSNSLNLLKRSRSAY